MIHDICHIILYHHLAFNAYSLCYFFNYRCLQKAEGVGRAQGWGYGPFLAHLGPILAMAHVGPIEPNFGPWPIWALFSPWPIPA